MNHLNETNAVDALQNKASELRERMAGVASEVTDKAEDIVASASEKVDGAISSLGDKLSDAGATIWENTPADGVLAKPLGDVAAGIESGGEYLRSHGVGDIASDVTEMVRKHPVPALAIGISFGLLLAAALRR